MDLENYCVCKQRPMDVESDAKELEALAIKVRNGDIPPQEVFEHFRNDLLLRVFKNKYRKEIRGMSPDYLRKIGYKKPTKKIIKDTSNDPFKGTSIEGKD